MFQNPPSLRHHTVEQSCLQHWECSVQRSDSETLQLGRPVPLPNHSPLSTSLQYLLILHCGITCKYKLFLHHLIYPTNISLLIAKGDLTVGDCLPNLNHSQSWLYEFLHVLTCLQNQTTKNNKHVRRKRFL